MLVREMSRDEIRFLGDCLLMLHVVVTFGDADRDRTFGLVATDRTLIICHDGDNICENGIIITAAHRDYEKDAPAAAAFVAARV